MWTYKIQKGYELGVSYGLYWRKRKKLIINIELINNPLTFPPLEYILITNFYYKSHSQLYNMHLAHM